MFDIGWTELVVIACVAILVVGPKDLPRMLRAFGKTMANVRRVAGDFRKQFDEAMREAEISDLAKTASSMTKFEPLEEARKAMADAQKTIKESVETSAAGIETAATQADHETKGNGSAPPEPAAETGKADPQRDANEAAAANALDAPEPAKPVDAEKVEAAAGDAAAREKAS